MGHSATHLDRDVSVTRGERTARYTEQCHLPWVKTALLEVNVLFRFDTIRVTECPVCCTSHLGSKAMPATTTAPDSCEGPCRWHSPQSIGKVCTTTPVRTGYSVTSLSVTETEYMYTISGIVNIWCTFNCQLLLRNNSIQIIQGLLPHGPLSADKNGERSGQVEIRYNVVLGRSFTG